MFIKATREKYRFPYNGLISVEDLWDLTPAQLDKVYKTLSKEKKSAESTDSLLTSTKPDDKLSTQIAIVRFIFETKQREAQERETKVANAEKRARVLEVLRQRQNDKLNAMSEDELKALLNDLG